MYAVVVVPQPALKHQEAGSQEQNHLASCLAFPDPNQPDLPNQDTEGGTGFLALPRATIANSGNTVPTQKAVPEEGLEPSWA